MLEIRDINKSYQNGNNSLSVLKNISLSIKEGEFVAIMGPSGSGKSTLLSILGILDEFDSGDYMLNGQSIKNLNQTQAAIIRNEVIGFVFQSFNLIPYKSALENIALPLFYQKKPRKERLKVATDFLHKVKLEDRMHHLPSELSGGQKQRVAIARALASKPKIILADEPTGALDSETSLSIMHLLQDINKEGITIVVITHELEIAQMTNRIITLKDGSILSDLKIK